MKTQYEFLRKIQDILRKPNQESLKMSLAETHHPNVFSLVIDGTEAGNLTRVFIAKGKLKPFEVQLHSHRYPIRLTTIAGSIKHFIAKEIDDNPRQSVYHGNVTSYARDNKVLRKSKDRSLFMSEFEYKSPLNKGQGLKYNRDVEIMIDEYPLPVGSTVNMSENDVHTMSCSKGSIWIVEEQGFKSDSSIVLGVPFITDGLYNKPQQFQINDNVQIVLSTINKILNDYEKVL